MKDDKGLYYYPMPANKSIRVYVRDAGDDIEFRMWNAADAGMWLEHGWVPYGAIQQAAKMYTGKGFDPDSIYDLSIAQALIDGDTSKRQ